MTVPDQDPFESLHLTNAGQVLATPYLPSLFSMLDLTDNGQFKNEEAASKAVHLLQFMVNGSTDSSESTLMLNKVLCGVAIGSPIEREGRLAEIEVEAVERMITAMILQWKAIGGTSVTGMRESFFQRKGILQDQSDHWHLTVEPSAWDLLLDRIPWRYSTIRHPWMDRALYVHWR